MWINEYKKFWIVTTIRIVTLSFVLFIAGCSTTGYVRPGVTPFEPPLISASEYLMNHPDFKKVVVASPEWVKLALKTINDLEREKLGRISPETE